MQPILAQYCQSFLCQFLGLMLRRHLPVEQGLLLVQGNESIINASIHMMFMRIDLAVIWINSSYNIVDVRLAKRWRLMYAPQAPARYILEANQDRINDFSIGDKVCFDEAWLDS